MSLESIGGLAAASHVLATTPTNELVPREEADRPDAAAEPSIPPASPVDGEPTDPDETGGPARIDVVV